MKSDQTETEPKKGNSYEKIEATAWITAYRRTFSDIPYAREFFDAIEVIRSAGTGSPIPEELKKPERAPQFEARYKLVNKLISEAGSEQVLEIAAGLSSRGFALTSGNKSLKYVELDLPGIIKSKTEVLDAMRVGASPNLFIEAGNALDEADIEKAAAHFEKNKPLTIVSEGLLAYLTLEEKTILAKNIHSLLASYGGVWITPDIIWNNTRTDYIQGMQKLTGSNIEQNRFKSEREAREFFEKLGFEVESRSFSEVAGQLESPKKLGQTPAETAEIIGPSVAFVLKVKK